MNRQGILTAGNFIVDCVKVVDRYPSEDMLAIIHSQSRCNGGGPYNVLKDLAAMGAGFPLAAAGLIGADADGEWIRADCEAHGIDTSLLIVTSDAATSYTDVMSNRTSGRRTFFHQPGANALFDGSRCEFQRIGAKLFHLGYLMLLEKLDGFSADGHTGASRLLERASAAGLLTSVDIVSTDHPDFRKIVLSSLPHVDFLIINELEAGRILGRAIDPSSVSELEAATRDLLALGVRRATVIHTEHGGCLSGADSSALFQPSLDLPAGYIKGANGAGDAFAAGFLYGIHEDWSYSRCLELAVCTAAACLADPTPSNGLRSVAECQEIGRRYGL